MTSHVKRLEGQEEHSFPAMTISQQSVQTVMSQSSGTGGELGSTQPLSAPSLSLRAKDVPRASLSAGHIAIRAKESVASGDALGADEHGAPAAQVIDAFEMLEKDLAKLESACSGLGTSDQQLHEASGAAFDAGRQAQPDPQISESVVPEADLAISQVSESHSASPVTTARSSQGLSLFSQKEFSTMNAHAQLQQEHVSTDAAIGQASMEPVPTAFQSPDVETDGVLHDVQSTLDSLAGMAHGLSQQKLELVNMRESLEERRMQVLERERQLAEREERLSQQEQRLHEEKQSIERVAEQNAAILAERSSALQALAESVESRDRATIKRAEALQQEQQHIERQLNQVRARAQELDEREVSLQRQGADLAARFKQLLDAKERFAAIVKGFNETVRFNTTYSAISKSVGTVANES
ncbi:hypothetical protein LNN38_24725 [Pseudomonas sp. LA21]|uniref:hypothetical protein n=2 Tax=unclassified Pseudomonas TaxID=196821 RepID=UPI001FB788D7|nr:hypothetical protein [Pseudomonas sp. LA21]MCJ1888080.1 hypothetical protein [Pseudomonas sp. LA21]